MPSREVAEEHYGELSSKPFFPDLISYITSGPVICMVPPLPHLPLFLPLPSLFPPPPSLLHPLSTPPPFSIFPFPPTLHRRTARLARMPPFRSAYFQHMHPAGILCNES